MKSSTACLPSLRAEGILRAEGKVQMSARLVESPHTLRIPPSAMDKKDLVAFSKLHGLRNEYLKDVLAGKPRVLVSKQTQHVWQSLTDVRWLRLLQVLTLLPHLPAISQKRMATSFHGRLFMGVNAQRSG